MVVTPFQRLNRQGIWIVDGGDVVIEYIGFIGAQMPAEMEVPGMGGNYCGVFAMGNVVLRNCYFAMHNMALRTANNGGAVYVVGSEFTESGLTLQGWSHNMYIGTNTEFWFIDSVSTGGTSNRLTHLVKSRAQKNFIINSAMIGGLPNPAHVSGRHSAAVDISQGGDLFVIGNVFQSTTGQPLLWWGKESGSHPTTDIAIVHNTFVGGNTMSAINISEAHPAAGTVDPVISNNLFQFRHITDAGMDDGIGTLLMRNGVNADNLVTAANGNFGGG
jgi:hypothetical protein